MRYKYVLPYESRTATMRIPLAMIDAVTLINLAQASTRPG